jgi:hypothetical protein
MNGQNSHQSPQILTKLDELQSFEWVSQLELMQNEISRTVEALRAATKNRMYWHKLILIHKVIYLISQKPNIQPHLYVWLLYLTLGTGNPPKMRFVITLAYIALTQLIPHHKNEILLSLAKHRARRVLLELYYWIKMTRNMISKILTKGSTWSNGDSHVSTEFKSKCIVYLQIDHS